MHVLVHRVDCTILKTFSSEPVTFGAIDFENEEQTKCHLWQMKLQIKWTAYGNFCSLDLCLHNQIVHDGTSSLANKFER